VPVRIGFDAIRALHNTTGLGNYSRGVLRGLHALDPSLELHLYTPRPAAQEFREFAAELNAGLHLPRPASRVPRLLPWRTFKVGRTAARDGIELYHGLTHEIPRDLPSTGVPSVATFHDLLFEKHPEFFPFFDRMSYRWRYRWSAAHATAIVAVSEATRADLIELYRIDPARITVIPPARDPRFGVAVTGEARAAVQARYDLPAEYLLAVGTLETRKNQAVLVEALAMLAPGEAPPLVLIGRDGGSAAALNATIRARGLERRALIRTGVTSADLPALVQGATLLLYPSLAEGFGMPIVEALSAGVPVIAAAGGHLSEAGGARSRYVVATDPAAWAAAIRELAGNRETGGAMIAAGREYAVRFDSARVAAQLLAVYDAIVSQQQLP